MTVITDSYTRGIVWPLTLDGEHIAMPSDSLSVQPRIHSSRVETADAGSRSFGPWVGDGFPDRIISYSFALPFSAIDGDARQQMMLAMARSGYRQFTHWQTDINVYTLAAGQQTLHLPKFRQNAAQVFAGLVFEGVAMSTAIAPFKAWLNGVALTVNPLTGPVVSVPASGQINLPLLPLTSGVYRDYVEFKIGNTIAAGDELVIDWFPCFRCELTEASIEYPDSIAESRSYVLTER